MSLYEYVENVENKSQFFSTGEMVHVCKRINNSKRDFLFVNRFQGKHVPVNPNLVIQLFSELAKQVIDNTSLDEKVVIIGFAETATAIGNYIASKLPNCIYYMQTTREREMILNKNLLEFKEEHSHAQEQLLCLSTDIFRQCDRIIFVEDEISTGNTILNFINALKKMGVVTNFSVASILNWQNDKWKEEFRKRHIDTFFLLQGELKDTTAKVEVINNAEVVIPKRIGKPAKIRKGNLSMVNERLGREPISFENMEQKIEVFARQLEIEPTSKEILVLGTEEFMYIPLMLAYVIQRLYPEKKIFFHATSRSPIETSDVEEYELKKRYKVASAYCKERNTYVYNLKKYDQIFVVTDGNIEDYFLNSLMKTLEEENNDNIEFIKF